MRNVVEVAKIGHPGGDVKSDPSDRSGSIESCAEFAALRLASTISTGHAGSARVVFSAFSMVRTGRRQSAWIGVGWNQRPPQLNLVIVLDRCASVRTRVSSVRCELSCGLLWRVRERGLSNQFRKRGKLADRHDLFRISYYEGIIQYDMGKRVINISLRGMDKAYLGIKS